MSEPQPIDALLARREETSRPDPGELWFSPDCRDSNHQKCDGIAWDLDEDALCDCGCDKCRCTE